MRGNGTTFRTFQGERGGKKARTRDTVGGAAVTESKGELRGKRVQRDFVLLIFLFFFLFWCMDEKH